MTANIKEFFDTLKDSAADKKVLVISIAAVCVVLFLDFRFVIARQIGIIKKQNPQITQLKQDISSVKKDLLIFRSLTTRWELATRKADLYSAQMVSADYIPYLLEDISKFARTYNVKVMQIRTSKNQSAKPVAQIRATKYTLLTVSLDSRASYQSLVMFLHKIETAPKFMRVASCDISPDPNDMYHHQVRLNIEACIESKE